MNGSGSVVLVAFLFFVLLIMQSGEKPTTEKVQSSQSTNCKVATRVLTDGSTPSMMCDQYYK